MTSAVLSGTMERWEVRVSRSERTADQERARIDDLREWLRARSAYVDALCKKIDRGHLGLVPWPPRKEKAP